MNFFIHPKHETFKDQKGEITFEAYDFLILTLRYELPATLCESVFAKLPSQAYTDDFLNEQELIASGWGSMIPLTHQHAVDINLGKDFKAIYGFDPFDYPRYLRMVDLYHLKNKICQKRYKDFFEKYKSAVGSRGTCVGDINFEAEPGASMICASHCISEDLANCENVGHKGTCVADSGCKYI